MSQWAVVRTMSARRPSAENTTASVIWDSTQQPRKSAKNQRVEETDCEVAAGEAQVSPTLDELNDYDKSELSQQTEIEGLRAAEVAVLRKELSQKEAEIAYLHQQNPNSLTSDEAHSTPYSSMNTEPSSPVTTAPTGEGSSFPKERDNVKVKGKQTTSTRVSELEEIVRQKVVELEDRLDQVTNLKHEVEQLTMELSKYEQGGSTLNVTSGKNVRRTHSRPTEPEREHPKVRFAVDGTAGGKDNRDGSTIESEPRSEKQIIKHDVNDEDITDGKQMDEREKERDVELQEKEETILNLQKEVQKLEKAATALGELQEHSKVQVLNLQDQAKASDAKRERLQISLDMMQTYVSELEEARIELSKNNGKLKDDIKYFKKEKKEVENALSIIEAKMFERDLTVDRLERSLSSLEDKLKVTMMENTTLKDRLRKVGFLQEESDRLSSERTKELEAVVAERDQLMDYLKMTRAHLDINQRLHDEVNSLNSTVAAQGKEVERLQRENQTLQGEIETHRITHNDISWAVQNEEIQLTQKELGRGAYGVVVVAEFRGLKVAAKCLYSDIISDYNRDMFVREMNIAAKLRHPNLVQLIGATLEGKPVILTELMTTSLRATLVQGPLEPAQIKSIGQDVARALNYMHLTRPDPILHRDISSANVLLNPTPSNGWLAKLSDYGSANFLRKVKTVGPGNPAYSAPEAAIPSKQSTKMDVFSFGVMLVEMVIRKSPDQDIRAAQVREAQMKCAHLPTLSGLAQLIDQCVADNPARRPTIGDVLSRFYSDIRKPVAYNFQFYKE